MDILELQRERDKLIDQRDRLIEKDEENDELGHIQAEIIEITARISLILNERIRVLSAGQNVPEMPTEGHKNTLIWLLEGPTAEEVRKALPMLQGFAIEPTQVRGWDKLPQEIQSKTIMELEANNYLLNLALEIIGKNAPAPVPYSPVTQKYAYINNTKVARNLPLIDQFCEVEEYANVNTKENGNETIVKVAIKYDNDKLQVSGAPLTQYDKCVLDAVCGLHTALAMQGKDCFTLQQVYRQMNGTDENVHPEAVEQIRESIKKMTVKRITIDATDQINARRKKKVKNATFESYLLPLNVARVEMPGGTILEGYRFIEKPAIYSYAGEIKQIIRVPIELLNTKNKVYNKPDIAKIRAYLIGRIASMKDSKARLDNNKILYATIYREAEIDTENLDKTQMKRIRDRIKGILDGLIEEGFISAYEESKAGRSIDGLVISWNKKRV